jgi:hypothetical protein
MKLCIEVVFTSEFQIKKFPLKQGSVHKIRNNFGGGVQRFVTNLCKNIGICTALRYERGREG